MSIQTFAFMIIVGSKMLFNLSVIKSISFHCTVKENIAGSLSSVNRV